MKCIICGQSLWNFIFDAKDRMFGVPGVFKEYRCDSCGLIAIHPQPTELKLARYYPSTKYYSYADTGKQSFFGRLRSYYISHLYSPTFISRLLNLFVHVPAMPIKKIHGKILDIGCGSGETLVQLQSIGWEGYGLDMDKKAIEIAQKRGVKHASYGTYKDLKMYLDNTFDVIRLYHVIEHLDDPRRVLALIRTKLKVGGELIIGTPNENSLVSRIFKQYWYNLDCPRHLYLFSPKTLRILVKQCSFINYTIEFSSAGGWIGSIQYVIEELFSADLDLINRQWLVILVYSLEWILDRLRWGDVFVLRAWKS